MTWVGFSEEGMLSSLDDNGILTAFDFKLKQFIPILDLKVTYPVEYRQIWVVGICDNELLAIELPYDHVQPHLRMKNLYKRIKLQIPAIGVEPFEEAPTLTHQDSFFMLSQMTINHEQFRKDTWEHHKNFRGRYESAKFFSDSILDTKDIIQKKRELDKLNLNSIRMCIVSE